MKTISIANQKGGVGKTTTAIALHDKLKSKGYKVLLIDTDQQRSSTKQFRAKTENEYTLYDVYMGECNLDKAIQKLPRGHIVPADELLNKCNKVLDGMKMYLHMKSAIAEMKSQYDFVILDCPPSINTILLNNLVATDELIIPTACHEIMSLEGLADLSKTIKDVREMANPNLNVSGILLIKYKKNTKLTKEIEKQLGNFEQLFDTKTFETKIRESIKLSESQTKRISIFEYAPTSTTAEDYTNLTEEFLKNIN